MKNIHIEFLPYKQEEFVNEFFLRSKFSTSTAAKEFNVSSRTVRDWKNGISRMPLSVVRKISTKYGIDLSEEEEVMMQRYKNYISQANKKGGIVRYKKYGIFATTEGRSKGGRNALAKMRKKGIIPEQKRYLSPFASEELAEFVGIMLGDGGITSQQCSIALNSIADKRYVEFVSQLLHELFGEYPKRYKAKKDKSIRLYYYGVDLIGYLISIGLKVGNKVKLQVDVPNWIKENKIYSNACLRGLIDTDGGVFIHTYKSKNKSYSYKKIAFTNRSLPLLQFVYDTLAKNGFTPKLIDKVENKKVWLYNAQEVRKYLVIIGSHNTRLSKFGEWAGR